jgi:hypothetical protein
MRKFLFVLALSFLGACAGGKEMRDLNATPQPAQPQPDAAALEDGLAVTYFGASYESIDDFWGWMDFREGVVGPPLTGLEYRTGKGNVLTSGSKDQVGAEISGLLLLPAAGSKDQVGAEISGLLLLPAAGSYQLSVTTNDGVRIHLGGARVHDDPTVGKDRTRESAPFEISQPGWYPLRIRALRDQPAGMVSAGDLVL